MLVENDKIIEEVHVHALGAAQVPALDLAEGEAEQEAAVEPWKRSRRSDDFFLNFLQKSDSSAN